MDLVVIVTELDQQQYHRVVLAREGRQGFELAKIYDFDAIVLDVMLPGMDGYAVTRKLRERPEADTILILTARR